MPSSSTCVPVVRRSVATIAVPPAPTAIDGRHAPGERGARRRARSRRRASARLRGVSDVRASRASCVVSQQRGVDDVAQAMDHQQVDLLDACGPRMRHTQMDVGAAAEVHRCGLRPCRSAQRRASRAGARPRSPRSRCAELPEVEMASSTSPLAPSARTCFGEDLLERIVVGDRGEQRRVGGQRDRRQLGAFALEAARPARPRSAARRRRSRRCRRRGSCRRRAGTRSGPPRRARSRGASASAASSLRRALSAKCSRMRLT